MSNPHASPHLNIVLETFGIVIPTVGELCDASTRALQPQVKRAHGRVELIAVGEGFIEAKIGVIVTKQTLSNKKRIVPIYHSIVDIACDTVVVFKLISMSSNGVIFLWR